MFWIITKWMKITEKQICEDKIVTFKQSHILLYQGLLFLTVSTCVIVDARSHTCKSHDFIPRYDIIPNTLKVNKSTTITTTVSQSSQGFASLVYGVCKAVTYTGHNQTYTTFRAWLCCGLVQYIETEAKRSPFSRRPFNACSWIEMHECSIIFQWSLFLEVQLTISQHWCTIRFDAD